MDENLTRTLAFPNSSTLEVEAEEQGFVVYPWLPSEKEASLSYYNNNNSSCISVTLKISSGCGCLCLDDHICQLSTVHPVLATPSLVTLETEVMGSGLLLEDCLPFHVLSWVSHLFLLASL